MIQTFAQFNETNGANDFQYTNNGSSSSPSATFTTPSGSAVTFVYSNIGNLPADLGGSQAATLTLNSSTTSAAFYDSASGNDVETLNNTTTIVITRDTPAAEGNGARDVLLSVTISSSTIQGPDGGSSATLNASSSHATVTFASDFLTFTGTTTHDVGLSFSSVTPNVSISAVNGLFSNFVAAGTGTFSSDPAPIVIPEASSIGPILALAGVIAAVQGLRRRKAA